MPKQFDKRRPAVDSYHRTILNVIRVVLTWGQEDVELQEYLDDNNSFIQEPPQFREFREAWEAAIIKGKKARVFQRTLNSHSLKIVAKEFWVSKARLRFYSGALGGRIRCMSSNGVEPVSFLDLERLYQHSLYKKGREQNGLDVIPFNTWCNTPYNVTFYDKLQ